MPVTQHAQTTAADSAASPHARAHDASCDAARAPQLAWANPGVALLNILMAVTTTYGAGCSEAFIMKDLCGSAALRSMVTNMVDLLDIVVGAG